MVTTNDWAIYSVSCFLILLPDQYSSLLKIGLCNNSLHTRTSIISKLEPTSQRHPRQIFLVVFPVLWMSVCLSVSQGRPNMRQPFALISRGSWRRHNISSPTPFTFPSLTSVTPVLFRTSIFHIRPRRGMRGCKVRLSIVAWLTE